MFHPLAKRLLSSLKRTLLLVYKSLHHFTDLTDIYGNYSYVHIYPHISNGNVVKTWTEKAEEVTQQYRLAALSLRDTQAATTEPECLHMKGISEKETLRIQKATKGGVKALGSWTQQLLPFVVPLSQRYSLPSANVVCSCSDDRSGLWAATRHSFPYQTHLLTSFNPN